MNMNTSTSATGIAGVIDSLRNASSRTTGQSLATVVEVVHQAYTKATTSDTADGQKRSEFNKWLIIAAAVVGGFFLLRGMRKLMKFAFVMFWVWMFAGGHTHRLFHFW